VKLTRLAAVSKKEFLQISRDARSLAMGIAMPVVLLVLFGYALSLDVDRVPLVVWDQSRTQASRDFLSLFQGSRYFSIGQYAGDYRGLERAINAGKAIGALVIRYDFAREVAAGRPTAVQLILDGSDSNTATITLGYAQAVVRGYSQGLTVDAVMRSGGTVPNPPIDLRPRVWFNENMESKNYIIPGLISIIMMIIAALLTSLTLAREWERGTMEQLISTPVKSAELILGKLLPYFAIAMFDVLIAVVMGYFVFGVPFRGNVILLSVIASVFLVGTLSLGILISARTKNQLAASQFALVLTFLPSFLLSGYVYPIANMPRPIQLVTYVVPATYLTKIMRGIYLKGVGLHVVWFDALLLVFFSAVMVALAAASFRKKLT